MADTTDFPDDLSRLRVRRLADEVRGRCRRDRMRVLRNWLILIATIAFTTLMLVIQ